MARVRGLLPVVRVYPPERFRPELLAQLLRYYAATGDLGVSGRVSAVLCAQRIGLLTPIPEAG